MLQQGDNEIAVIQEITNALTDTVQDNSGYVFDLNTCCNNAVLEISGSIHCKQDELEDIREAISRVLELEFFLVDDVNITIEETERCGMVHEFFISIPSSNLV